MSKFNLDGALVIDIETRGLLDKLKSMLFFINKAS